MDSKGTEEEIAYPNIFFTIDNFEEVSDNTFVEQSLETLTSLLFNEYLLFYSVVLVHSFIHSY